MSFGVAADNLPRGVVDVLQCSVTRRSFSDKIVEIRLVWSAEVCKNFKNNSVFKFVIWTTAFEKAADDFTFIRFDSAVASSEIDSVLREYTWTLLDVLFAAKEIAQKEKKSTGQVMSELARKAFAVGAYQPQTAQAVPQVSERLAQYGIQPCHLGALSSAMS